MSNLTVWPRDNLAIHDLVHLGGLSADRTIPLLVSQRTLYLAQNFAAHDILLQRRYAVSYGQGSYQQVQEEDDEYGLFLTVVDNFGLEMTEGVYGVGTPDNYKEKYLFIQVNPNATAGLNILSTNPPPDDVIFKIESIDALNNTSVCSDIIILEELSGNIAPLAFYTNQPAGKDVILNGRWSLSDGATLKAYFYGCAPGDDLFLRVTGYSMSRSI